MNKSVRFSVIMLALLLVISSLGLVGFASSEAELAEPITFTILNGDTTAAVQVEPRKTEIWEAIKAYTNVDLEVEYIVGQDGEQKAGLLIASGDYPDLIVPHNSYRTYINAEAVIPINDLLNLAPNLREFCGEDMWNLMTDDAGNIYSWGRSAYNPAVVYPTSSFYISNGALKSRDYPTISTWDEYVDLIREYVAANPTIDGAPTIGFSGPSESWRIVFSFRGADRFNGRFEDFIRDIETGEVLDYYEAETLAQNREYYKMLNALNREGLLDPEMFSQTYDQYVAKLSSGRVVAFFDETWESVGPALPVLRAYNMEDSYPVPVRILKEGVTEDYYNGTMSLDTQPAICITSNCKDPERAIRFFDDLAREEVQKLLQWGIEGTHYDVKDGNIVLSDEQYANRSMSDFQERTGIGLNLYNYFPHPTTMGKFSDGTDWAYWYSSTRLDRVYDDVEKGILGQYGVNDYTELFDKGTILPNDIATTNPPAVEEFWRQWSEVDPTRYFVKAVLAKDDAEFDAIWTELEDAMKQLDLSVPREYQTELAFARMEKSGAESYVTRMK